MSEHAPTNPFTSHQPAPTLASREVGEYVRRVLTDAHQRLESDCATAIALTRWDRLGELVIVATCTLDASPDDRVGYIACRWGEHGWDA